MDEGARKTRGRPDRGNSGLFAHIDAGLDKFQGPIHPQVEHLGGTRKRYDPVVISFMFKYF